MENLHSVLATTRGERDMNSLHLLALRLVSANICLKKSLSMAK